MCAPHGGSPRTTPSAGTEFVGVYHGRKSAPDCGVQRWKSNDGWMALTGYASGNAICACGSARNRHLSSQVLPAYGLQDLRSEKSNLPRSSNPNTMCLPNTLGENLGGGRFYLAKKRTFLLCVDMSKTACCQSSLEMSPSLPQ